MGKRRLLRYPALFGLLLAVALVAGCSGNAAAPPQGNSSAVSSPTELLAVATAVATPSTASAASAGPAGEVAEDWTFSGALAGHVTKAHRGDSYICAGGDFVPKNPNTKGQFVAGPIVGDLGGKEIRMNVTKIDYHGPGSYDGGGVGFDIGSDHYYPASAPSGTFTINADGRGGTVSMDLALNSAPTTKVGHVEGTWACPAHAF